jgi:hypothetical protein
MGKIQLTEGQYERLKKNLINNTINEGEQLSTTLGYAGKGAAMGLLTGPLAPIAVPVGGLIGAAYGYLEGAGGSFEGVKKIFQACNKSGVGKPTINNNTMDSIAAQIHKAVEGFGFTDEDSIKNALSKIPTIPDLCAVKKRYKENYPGFTLFGDLDGDIDDDSEWNEYVYLPLLKAVRKTKELSEKAKEISKQKETELKKLMPKAANCGWITKNSDGSTTPDVEGYRKSGWKCPKEGSKLNKKETQQKTQQKTYSKPQIASKASDYLD